MVAETGKTPESLSIYVHWPFCLSRCPYCDFNAHVRETIDQTRWRDAYLREIRHIAELLPGREIVSIFFGGGTPSLMEPATTAAILDAIGDRWSLAPDIEITLEANPTSVETARLKDLRIAGITRVSLGVQALDETSLRFLGRGHDVAQAKDAVSLAARTFDRYSFDLIYARPGQTVGAWRAELAEAFAMAGDHLSLYQLTVERGTPFFAAERAGDFALPEEELAAALFDVTQELCVEAGLPAYEISNHARPGGECRPNIVYWTGGDYAGVGPGAHGRLKLDGATRATEQIPGPENWIDAVERHGHGTRRDDALRPDERVEELFMTGLRLTAGIGRGDFAARAGLEIEDALEPRRLRRLIEGGFMELDEAGLRTTADGWLRLNAVLAALLG